MQSFYISISNQQNENRQEHDDNINSHITNIPRSSTNETVIELTSLNRSSLQPKNIDIPLNTSTRMESEHDNVPFEQKNRSKLFERIISSLYQILLDLCANDLAFYLIPISINPSIFALFPLFLQGILKLSTYLLVISFYPYFIGMFLFISCELSARYRLSWRIFYLNIAFLSLILYLIFFFANLIYKKKYL